MDTSLFFAYPDSAVKVASEFLAGLHEDEVKAILGFMETWRVAKGEVVVKHGETDRGLYIVTKGRFEVLVPSRRGPRLVSYLAVGDVFGELAFFDEQPRSADVRAAEPSEVMVMAHAGFERLRSARPQLALSFAFDLGRVLSLRFRELNQRLVALSAV